MTAKEGQRKIVDYSTGIYPRPPVGESQCPRPRRRSARAGGGGATRFYMLGSWALVASSVPGPPRAKMPSKRFKTLRDDRPRSKVFLRGDPSGPPRFKMPSKRSKTLRDDRPRGQVFPRDDPSGPPRLQNAPKRSGTTAPRPRVPSWRLKRTATTAKCSPNASKRSKIYVRDRLTHVSDPLIHVSDLLNKLIHVSNLLST